MPPHFTRITLVAILFLIAAVVYFFAWIAGCDLTPEWQKLDD